MSAPTTDTPISESPTTTTSTAPSTGPARVPRPRKPRRPREFTSTDTIITVACFVSAVSLCWLVFGRLTGGIGWFGFGLAVFAAFLTLLFIVTADRFDRSVAADRVVTATVFTIAVVLFVPLVSIVAYVLWKGLPASAPALLHRRPARHHADDARNRRWRFARRGRDARAGRSRAVVVAPDRRLRRGVPQRVARASGAGLFASSSMR